MSRNHNASGTSLLVIGKFKDTIKNIPLLLCIAPLLFVSCNDNKAVKRYVDEKQLPTINSPKSKIDISGLDSLVKDKQFCASVTQTQTNLKLIAAYIGSHPNNECDFSKSLVDTLLKSINNCSIELKKQNDTAYFCLTPSVAKKFIYKLAVLSVDKDNNYYLDTLNMNFVVNEKTNL